MAREPIIYYKKVIGVNNVDDPSTITPDIQAGFTVYVTECINYDIKTDGTLVVRDGYEKLSSTPTDSLYAKGEYLYYKEGKTLKAKDFDFNNYTIATLQSSEPLQYAEFPQQLCLTNGTDIGIISGLLYSPFTDFTPSKDWQKHMPAGHLTTYWNGKMLVAVGDKLYESEPFAPYFYDDRKAITPLPNRITMLSSVADGYYLSSGAIYFISGNAEKRTAVIVSGSPAYEGSAVSVDLKMIGDAGTGNGIIWTSQDGIFVGKESGKVENKTMRSDGQKITKVFDVPRGTYANAYIKKSHNNYQYVVHIRK